MSSKLREALEDAWNLLQNIDFDKDSNLDDMAAPVLQKISEALAEPPRNCDVGSPKEQGERFILFCRRNSFRGVCNDSCKLATVSRRLGWQEIGNVQCFPFWAQMPYKKEGEECQ